MHTPAIPTPTLEIDGELHTNEAYLSQLCSNLKESLVKCRHTPRYDILRLREKLNLYRTVYAQSPQALQDKESISKLQEENELPIAGNKKLEHKNKLLKDKNAGLTKKLNTLTTDLGRAKKR